MRTSPASNARVTQVLLEDFKHLLETRTQQLRVLAHVCGNALGIFQKAYVTQLVEFVEADGLRAHRREHLVYVGNAGNKSRNTRSGKGHLGGRAKLEDHVGIARIGASIDDVENMILILGLIVEVVHDIGVVPEDPEIASGRLKCGETAHDLVRVRIAAGVGVLRDAPDALYRRICHEARDLGDVRAILAQLDGNHLDAEVLAYGEVTIIARSRADELDALELAPGQLPA